MLRPVYTQITEMQEGGGDTAPMLGNREEQLSMRWDDSFSWRRTGPQRALFYFPGDG